MSVPLAELLTPRHLVLDSWRHERTFHRPGAGVCALYRVRALDRNGAALSLYAGAATSPLSATALLSRSAPQAVHTSLAGTALSLWLHPHDPLLSGLPWALDPANIARDVFDLDERGGAGVVLELTAYRPLRRGVVRAVSGNQQAYLKVLLPGHAEGLRRRHRMLAGTPVPAAGLLGLKGTSQADAHGAVVLAALEGEPLLRALAAGTHGLRPEDLTALLDQLPGSALSLKRRPAWAERARAYGQAAAAVLPAEAEPISAMAARIEELAATLDPGPVVPVHGDFYEGNLLARNGRITGLLDIDGMGPGHRVDDLACFTGHLAVLAELSPRSALRRELEVFQTGFEEAAAAAGSSPAALNARAAGVALSLVSGARAGKLGRTENALARLQAARTLLERAHEPGSASPQV